MSKKALINRILKIAIAVMVLAAFLFISILIVKGVLKTFKDTERNLNTTATAVVETTP